jgi:phosphosulfolactate phosphohydrolase-like enzyme
MRRGNVSHWFHEHHILPVTQWHSEVAEFVDLLRATWVIMVLLLLGLVALVTAVLIAWPALSYLGAKLIG